MSKKIDKESIKKISNKKSGKRKNTAIVQNLEKEIESLKEKNIKLLAEFDNYKRRTNQEKQDLVAFLKTLTDTDFISRKKP